MTKCSNCGSEILDGEIHLFRLPATCQIEREVKAFATGNLSGLGPYERIWRCKVCQSILFTKEDLDRHDLTAEHLRKLEER